MTAAGATADAPLRATVRRAEAPWRFSTRVTTLGHVRRASAARAGVEGRPSPAMTQGEAGRGRPGYSEKIRQVVVPWARRRPLASVMRPSAVPVRRPAARTMPSARTGPVSMVIGRMKLTLNSSVV